MPERKKNIVKLYQTSKSDNRKIEPVGDLSMMDEDRAGVPDILLDVSGKGYQEIVGIGGAFTESGGYVLSKMGPGARKKIVDAYFHPKTGMGYTLCRTHINSCDFSLDNYSSDDVDGDLELKHFNIERDRKYLIPFIRDAQKVSGNSFKLLASPWSPPKWMKTNGQMNRGGKLKADCGDAWALFYAKYVKAYRKQKIDIWGLTVQNEPEATQRWDSCIYTAEEERDFVRDHLGPTLKKQGLSKLKVIIYDHNRDHIYDRAKTVFSDKQANKFTWGIGYHWYVSDEHANVNRVFREFPDKRIIFTEGCIEGGAKPGQWDRGEIYARSMINDFNNGASGWIDWNMVLDINGGPNHAENFCEAPVLVDLEKNNVVYQSSFYYIGHFSRFVRPGAVRVDCTSSNPALETCAFRNRRGGYAVIVLNRSDKETDYQFKAGSLAVRVKSPAHSIQTLLLGDDAK